MQARQQKNTTHERQYKAELLSRIPELLKEYDDLNIHQPKGTFLKVNLLVAAIYYDDLELSKCVVDNFKKLKLDLNKPMLQGSSPLDLAYDWHRFKIADFLEQQGKAKCLLNEGKGPTTTVFIREMHKAQQGNVKLQLSGSKS